MSCEVVRNEQNSEIIQINVSISMSLTNINKDALTAASDIHQKLEVARIAEHLEVNSNDKNLEVGRKNKNFEVLKGNAPITMSLINTNQNAFTTISDSDENFKVVSIDENFEETRNDPYTEKAKIDQNLKVGRNDQNMKLAKNEQNLEEARNDQNMEISKNYQHLEIGRKDQHRDIVINDQNLEEVRNNKNMKRAKYDQNLEVARNNQNRKRAKTDQNLVVARNDQNMESAKNHQNLEVARNDQNMEIAANDQNLEEIKKDKNMKITTTDLNLEETKSDQNLEAYIIDQNQPKENSLLNSIKNLHPRLIEWMIRARVIYKTSVFSYGEGQGKYFSFWLLDDSGEIQAKAFDKDAERIFSLLKENNVYLISNAYVQSRKYNCPSEQEFELIINKSAKIKPNVGDESTIPLLTFNFKSIFCIKSLPQKSFTDVIGICENISDTRTINTKVKENSTVKNFILRDITETITVTLWNEVAKNFKYTGDHVVAIRNARVTDYNGCALTITAMSMIFVDPKIPEATELRSWFHNIDPSFSKE